LKLQNPIVSSSAKIIDKPIIDERHKYLLYFSQWRPPTADADSIAPTFKINTMLLNERH